MLDDEEVIGRLAHKLRQKGADRTSGLGISLRLRESEKAEFLMVWMDAHPEATPMEILKKSREIEKIEIV